MPDSIGPHREAFALGLAVAALAVRCMAVGHAERLGEDDAHAELMALAKLLRQWADDEQEAARREQPPTG